MLPRVLIAPLLMISVYNLVSISRRLSSMFANESSRVSPSHRYHYIAHDFPMTLPLSPREPELVAMTVEESVHFPLLGDESDPIWASITSSGSGYIHLGPDNRLFMVTMFHEIHCLRVLNFAYAGSLDAPAEHVDHCLNYLRQSSMCAADTTLEPGDFTLQDFEAERQGARHICRDWSAAYRAMQEGWDRWRNGTGS